MSDLRRDIRILFFALVCRFLVCGEDFCDRSSAYFRKAFLPPSTFHNSVEPANICRCFYPLSELSFGKEGDIEKNEKSSVIELLTDREEYFFSQESFWISLSRAYSFILRLSSSEYEESFFCKKSYGLYIFSNGFPVFYILEDIGIDILPILSFSKGFLESGQLFLTTISVLTADTDDILLFFHISRVYRASSEYQKKSPKLRDFSNYFDYFVFLRRSLISERSSTSVGPTGAGGSFFFGIALFIAFTTINIQNAIIRKLIRIVRKFP